MGRCCELYPSLFWIFVNFAQPLRVLYSASMSLFLFCRGQESAGIVMSAGEDAYKFSRHRDMGLVNTVFPDSVLSKLKGNLGIGK